MIRYHMDGVTAYMIGNGTSYHVYLDTYLLIVARSKLPEGSGVLRRGTRHIPDVRAACIGGCKVCGQPQRPNDTNHFLARKNGGSSVQVCRWARVNAIKKTKTGQENRQLMSDALCKAANNALVRTWKHSKNFFNFPTKP